MNEIQEDKTSPPPLQYIHSWHYDMLINQERSHFYNNLLKETCHDKVVFEIGTGSGLLAVLAVKHGAKKVICCEENPLLALAAQQLFKRLHLENHIQLILKNSKDIRTDEIPPADLILHELFGSDPFGEEMVPTLSDARRFLKPGGIFLPEKIQIIYHPVRSHQLPEKLYFEDIELLEMSKLLSQIHPSLRVKTPAGLPPEVFFLPEITIEELIKTSYSYTETNDKLIDVDAIAVSFKIIHQGQKLQAATFEPAEGRVHWYPLIFYKLDVHSNQLCFSLKNQIQLMVL
jgi:predicted RNA methylase